MRCDYCPLSAPEDVCPEAEGKYGVEHQDGMLGCSHPWNWVKKRDNDYNEYLGNMGLDRGIEMDFTSEELNKVIDICRHMIGLNYKRPYHRHGKAFYKPYRNYYCDIETGNNLLNRLPKDIIYVRGCEEEYDDNIVPCEYSNAEGAKEALARYIEAVKEYNTSLLRKSNDKDNIEIETVIAE